jgi:hypothetical protein
MTWKELNWFQFEGSVFVEELKGTFTTILTTMDDEFQESRKRRDADISSQTDNEYMHNELAWSEDRLHKQSQILTTMVFTVTFRAIQDFLNELLYWHTGTNPDLEKLHKLETEYQKIGVVLPDQKEFDIIKELRVARNSCVHNSNKPDAEYQQHYPKSRWIDEHDYVNITRAQWNDLLLQLERWANNLVQRMNKNKREAGRQAVERT